MLYIDIVNAILLDETLNLAVMNIINVFYTNTTTVDYSIKLKRAEDGIGMLVTSSEHSLEDEYFPSETTKDFIEDYGDEYIGELKYELLEGGHFTLDNDSD